MSINEWKEDTCTISKSDRKRINRWKRAIKRGSGPDYVFLHSVLVDAKEKQEQPSYSKYYQCAKFIRDYNIGDYKYRKIQTIQYACCRQFPDACVNYEKTGLHCSKDRECKCFDIPDSWEKYGNCFDDCCVLYKKKHSRRFIIKWI
jgi:hypothetical protein